MEAFLENVEVLLVGSYFPYLKMYEINLLSILDYDSSAKAISAMCEIAVDTCQAWFPQDEK